MQGEPCRADHVLPFSLIYSDFSFVHHSMIVSTLTPHTFTEVKERACTDCTSQSFITVWTEATLPPTAGEAKMTSNSTVNI